MSRRLAQSVVEFAVVFIVGLAGVAEAATSAASPFEVFGPASAGLLFGPAAFLAPAPLADATDQWRYAGTLTTTVGRRGCSADSAPTTTRIPTILTVRPPLQPTADGPDVPPAVGREANPVNLVLGQTAAAGYPGAIQLASAVRYAATSPSLILEYWRLSLAGSTLNGSLYDAHVRESAAANLLAAETELVPCQPQFGSYPNQLAIDAGARLNGTLTADGARLRIEGNVVDRTRPFAAELVAARTP